MYSVYRCMVATQKTVIISQLNSRIHTKNKKTIWKWFLLLRLIGMEHVRRWCTLGMFKMDLQLAWVNWPNKEWDNGTYSANTCEKDMSKTIAYWVKLSILMKYTSKVLISIEPFRAHTVKYRACTMVCKPKRQNTSPKTNRPLTTNNNP